MSSQKLIYDVNDRPKLKNLLLYALQLLFAIIAATVAFPNAIGLPIQVPSAILGAGIGTLVYILFTKGKSPIFLSSSFTFLGAFPTAIAFGYMGILIGGLLSGLVYVLIAVVVKFCGTKWVARLMPPVIIGPIVTLIGLSLASDAVIDFVTSDFIAPSGQPGIWSSYNWIAIICGFITFATVVMFTVQNKNKNLRLIPFFLGVVVGYIFASIFTGVGYATNNEYLIVVDYSPLVNNFTQAEPWRWFFNLPHITIVEAFKELANGQFTEAITIANGGVAPSMINGTGVATIAIAFCPIALVTFAEHIADHKNVSSIIAHDLINDDPGLCRTLLGDGVGSIAGTVFGICPNTSYGEGIACLALTKNASVITTLTTACMCILLSFLAPFSSLSETIPSCVMGGICLSLFGYISVSGLKMFKDLDLDDDVNLLTVCAILISGVGGLALKIPYELGMTPEECKYLIVGNVATAFLIGAFVYHVGSKVAGRKKNAIAEINKDIKYEDMVRSYLKRFSVDELAEGLLTFGFMHENVDYTVALLSSFLRSEEIMSLRTQEELTTIVKLFKFWGYKENMSKEELVKLLKYDCEQIDKRMIKDITGSEINLGD